jgi:hypothetical protein
MSYANFLSRLIAYGELVRQHWPLILALIESAKALYNALGKELPGTDEGTLQLVVASDDELNAEERLAHLIDGDKQSLSVIDRFRKAYRILKALGLLDSFFGDSLGS